MKEEEIRKSNAFNKYLELVSRDCLRFFGDKVNYTQNPCPACGCVNIEDEFTKDGFTYGVCCTCGTLYACRRPGREQINLFYTSSDSTTFWVNNFFKPVAEARREKIFRPRADYIAGLFGADPLWLIGDVGAGFGIFSEELKKLWPGSSYVAIEPSPEQAEYCRAKGLNVECSFLEDLKGYDGSFDLLTAFELFEHIYEPAGFLSAIYRLLKPGGRFLMTTLNSEGFDIQVLWERSKSITPPHHLNFFNPGSVRLLLEKNGFLAEEITTPGKLDWDIVEGMIQRDGIKIDRLWHLIAGKCNDKSKTELQEWIARNNLSSHMRVLARKHAAGEGRI